MADRFEPFNVDVSAIDQSLKGGIRTDSERQRIEYRPDIQYTKPEIDSVNNVVTQSDSADSDIDLLSNVLPSIVLDSAAKLYDKTNSLIQEVENVLREKPAAKVSDEIVLEAGSDLGLDLSGGIPTNVYRDLKEDLHNDEYEKQLIIGAWEDYQADIDGSMAGEYYTDLLDIRQDLIEFFDFISRGLIHHIDPKINANHLDPYREIDELRDAEQALLNRLKALKSIMVSLDNEIRQIMIVSMDPNHPTNIELNQLESKYFDIRDDYTILFRKSSVLSEIACTAVKKIDMVDFVLDLMDRNLKSTPQNAFNGQLSDALEATISPLVDSGFGTQLTRLQATLRYAFDGKAKKIASNKKKSDAVLNNQIKSIMQDMTVRDSGIKVGLCHPMIQKLEKIPAQSAASMELIAQDILDGIEEAERNYNENVVQLYGIYKGSAEAQITRTIDISSKQNTRDLYHIVNAMSSNLRSGSNIPSKTSLKSWTSGILNEAGLNKIYNYESGSIEQLKL